MCISKYKHSSPGCLEEQQQDMILSEINHNINKFNTLVSPKIDSNIYILVTSTQKFSLQVAMMDIHMVTKQN